jgi:hypothetical protein
MRVINYDYIQEISAEDALKNSASDVTSWYNWGIPWVNTFKINAETSVYNEQWGWSWIACWSTNVSWSSSDYNTVAWSSWDINLPDWTTLTVTSWNTGNMSTTTYIYYDRSDNTVKTTTTSADSVWENKILLCVAAPTVSWKDAEFQAFGCGDQSTFIHADQIAANTITANEIASNTITASEMNVYQLSAITSNLWDVTVWSNNDSKIRIYPNWQQGRIDFSYDWSLVGYIVWQSVSWPGDTVYLVWGNNGNWNVAVAWKLWCLGKVRIPVWTNLY